ncbi:MarR family winged helix-turn-helix transcriptional regulator [Amycolatopsis taiwanensis]|uniref:MarR family winged helix-turn-helix transcriptional regulator n=1 Tax=Amycolatopsis taiwanensis TaxID=342230 RepID=UPI0004B0AA7C|nr:MarR family transcriptional regulator [Amycolatopsis taiwanensis]
MAGKQAAAAAQRILGAMPDWGHAIAQLNAVVAERMGVTLSDLDCLDALNKHGPATASTLARFVDLTSGSVSRMIDRLDAAGCIKRVQDPHDRRKVLIEPTADGLERVRSYYASLAACTLDDLAEFTEAELAVVQRFIDKARESTNAELTRLRKASSIRPGNKKDSAR